MHTVTMSPPQHTLTYSPFALGLDTADKYDPNTNQIPQGVISVQGEIPVMSSFVHLLRPFNV